MNQLNPSENPDGVQPNAKIRKNVMDRINFPGYIKYITVSIFLLFLSPILLLLSNPEIFQDRELAYMMLTTLGILISIYTVLCGIFFSYFKIPFLKEWKNKLGYKE